MAEGRALGAAGTARLRRAPAGPLCRLSAPRFILRGQARDEGAEERLLRRYRLLHARQCHAARHGRHLPLHGCGHRHRAGHRRRDARHEVLRLCRRFDLLRLVDHGHRQRCLQSGGSHGLHPRQLDDGHDGPSAASGHGPYDDGPDCRQGLHRRDAQGHRRQDGAHGRPARPRGSHQGRQGCGI